jgi:hypothetical protein
VRKGDLRAPAPLERAHLRKTKGSPSEPELELVLNGIWGDIANEKDITKMSTIPEFATMTAQERADIVNDRQNMVIRVPKSASKAANLANLSRSRLMPTHVEIPPSPVVLDDRSTAQIFIHSPGGLEGAWQRLFIMTYNKGGRVFYRDLDADNVEAVFRFQ